MTAELRDDDCPSRMVARCATGHTWAVAVTWHAESADGVASPSKVPWAVLLCSGIALVFALQIAMPV